MHVDDSTKPTEKRRFVYFDYEQPEHLIDPVQFALGAAAGPAHGKPCEIQDASEGTGDR